MLGQLLVSSFVFRDKFGVYDCFIFTCSYYHIYFVGDFVLWRATGCRYTEVCKLILTEHFSFLADVDNDVVTKSCNRKIIRHAL